MPVILKQIAKGGLGDYASLTNCPAIVRQSLCVDLRVDATEDKDVEF